MHMHVVYVRVCACDCDCDCGGGEGGYLCDRREKNSSPQATALLFPPTLHLR